MKGNEGIQNKYSTRGITLIALVVTIIVLLILAGITINLVIGKNGIIKRAKEAEEEMLKASIQEEISFAVVDIQMEILQNGETMTLEKIAEKLPQKLDLITAEVENNQIVGEYREYEYTIDPNLKVVVGEKIKGIKITYTVSEKEYTNQDITLTVNATSTNASIVSLTGPADLVQNADGSYLVTKNGSYTFVVEDSLGNTKQMKIIISNIDKLEPQGIREEIEVTSATSLKIIVDAEDEKANADNTCSGIEKYEYYINGTKYETTEKEYIAENLDPTIDYTIYVVVYDKAGNSKKMDEIQPVYYEWEKWSLGVIYTENVILMGQARYSASGLDGERIGSSYSIDKQTGTITLRGTMTYSKDKHASVYKDKYMVINRALHKFTGEEVWGGGSSGTGYDPEFEQYRLETETGKKNLEGNVKSFYQNTFPNDGEYEGYWYTSIRK